MGKARPALVRFNGGEVSEQTLARVDLQGYTAYAEELENAFPEIEGALSKAPGTRYIGTAAGSARLRPFEYSSSSNLVLELTDRLVRFIQDGAYLSLAGADATIGAWSDQSAAPSAGGGAAPDEGSGDVTPPSGGGLDLTGGSGHYWGDSGWDMGEIP